MTSGASTTPDGMMVSQTQETEVAVARDGGLTALDLRKLVQRLDELEVRDTARVLTGGVFGGYVPLKLLAVRDSDRSSVPVKP